MDLTKFSDQELISAYISGKHSSINVIINRHRAKLMGYIVMSVKDIDIANDIFQDTFIKVISKLRVGAYNEEGKFIQWVLRIAHNLIIDYYRKESKVKMVRSNDVYDIFNTLPMYDTNAEDEMMKLQTHAKVRELVELLPDNQREVLKMRHFQEMSFKDIAEQTEVSINTALGRMRYAIINLRKMVEENDIILSH